MRRLASVFPIGTSAVSFFFPLRDFLFVGLTFPIAKKKGLLATEYFTFHQVEVLTKLPMQSYGGPLGTWKVTLFTSNRHLVTVDRHLVTVDRQLLMVDRQLRKCRSTVTMCRLLVKRVTFHVPNGPP